MEALTGTGEKIKSLRKGRSMTQQQLADCLNISFQSVSKWETGDAYPDISMIPKLAIIFDTTADEILCIDKAKTESEIDTYIEKKREYNKIGDIDKMLSVMREADEKFPGNCNIMSNLISAMFFVAKRDCNDDLRNEILEKGKYILSHCNDGNTRASAIQLMSYSYKDLNMKEEGLKFIEENTMTLYNSREVLLEDMEDKGSKERLYREQQNLFTFLYFTVRNMCHISDTFSVQEKIEVYENVIKIYEMLFPCGDYGTDHFHVARKYSTLTDCYLEIKNCEKALEYLNKKCEQTVKADTLINFTVYTSPLFRGVKYNGFTKDYTGNASFHMLNSLSDEKYDPIRDTDQFRQIEETLKKYADENA